LGIFIAQNILQGGSTSVIGYKWGEARYTTESIRRISCLSVDNKKVPSSIYSATIKCHQWETETQTRGRKTSADVKYHKGKLKSKSMKAPQSKETELRAMTG
jgi:hypothetical protein